MKKKEDIKIGIELEVYYQTQSDDECINIRLHKTISDTIVNSIPQDATSTLDDNKEKSENTNFLTLGDYVYITNWETGEIFNYKLEGVYDDRCL